MANLESLVPVKLNDFLNVRFCIFVLFIYVYVVWMYSCLTELNLKIEPEIQRNTILTNEILERNYNIILWMRGKSQ